MPGGHEILTLQFGGFANYIGSHYWNIQDEILGLQSTEAPGSSLEINSDILFREGQTTHGDSTYTPRLIFFDVSGSLGAISTQGSLYNTSPSLHLAPSTISTTWSGKQEVHRTALVAKTAFLQHLEAEAEEYESYSLTQQQQQQAHVDNTNTTTSGSGGPSAAEIAAGSLEAPGAVNYFTDYLKTHLHPRSACLLPGAWTNTNQEGGSSSSSNINTSSSGVFETGGRGSTEIFEDASERIRLFAEECDALRGLQCIVQEGSGWGRLATKVLEEVKDEYTNRAVLLFSAQTPEASSTTNQTANALQRQRLDHAISLASFSQHCDLLVPLSNASAAFPHLQWRRKSWFHESAVYAAAIDSITLPYRLITESSSGSGAVGRVDPRSLAQLVVGQRGANLAAVQMAMPCVALPPDPAKQAQRSDTRVEHSASGSSGGRGNTAGGSNASERDSHHKQQELVTTVTSLTQGVPNGKDSGQYAECVVLRGARRDGQAASITTMCEELDNSLLREGVRAVRHRVVATQPLPVPLPFPKLFAPTVARYGDIVPRYGASAVDVVSCPVLTRLSGTKTLQPVLQGAQREAGKAWTSAVGQSALDAWGWGKEEQQECAEQLLEMVHSYEDDED